MEYIPTAFNSVEDECRFWKKLAQKYYKDWSVMKQDFDEYVQESSQIELEMDTELSQHENTIKALTNKVALLRNESETLKCIFDSRFMNFNNMEKQLECAKQEREIMKNDLRILEQKNDDLERIQRRLSQNVQDTEKLLEKSFETIALLETEINDKILLEKKLQSLNDEMVKVKEEIDILAGQSDDIEEEDQVETQVEQEQEQTENLVSTNEED